MSDSKALTKEEAALNRDFTALLARLVITWANAESHFVHVLRILLRTDEDRARLIFYTVQSTRARLELIQVAALMFLKRRKDVEELNGLCSEFRAVTRKRNLLCHAQYMIHDSLLGITDLLSHEFSLQNFDGVNYLKWRKLDKGLLNEIRQETKRAGSLCDRLQNFVDERPAYVLARQRHKPLPLRKSRSAKSRRLRPKTQPTLTLQQLSFLE
jgi:hypothetical protein